MRRKEKDTMPWALAKKTLKGNSQNMIEQNKTIALNLLRKILISGKLGFRIWIGRVWRKLVRKPKSRWNEELRRHRETPRILILIRLMHNLKILQVRRPILWIKSLRRPDREWKKLRGNNNSIRKENRADGKRKKKPVVLQIHNSGSTLSSWIILIQKRSWGTRKNFSMSSRSCF